MKVFLSQLLFRNFPKNNINIPILEVPLSRENKVNLTEMEWRGVSRGALTALPCRPNRKRWT